MIDAIGFDLDGTLWNAVKPVREAFNLVRSREGYPPVTEEQITAIMGKTSDQVAAMLNPGLPRAEALALHRRCTEREQRYMESHRGLPYPGVPEALAVLARQYPLFLVSNCQAGYTGLFRTLPGVKGLFADYEEAGRTGLSKGENIALVCRRNGWKNPLYVGDTAGDQAAAARAGAVFVHAAYGFGRAPEAKIAIGSLPELISILKEV